MEEKEATEVKESGCYKEGAKMAWILFILVFLICTLHINFSDFSFLENGSRMNVGFNFMYPGILKDPIEKSNFKITHAQNLPENSLLVATDDFELITKNLPQPYIIGQYDEDFVFEDWNPQESTKGKGNLKRSGM